MMRVPVQWLKDYVSIDTFDINHVVERLIMTGSNSEGYKSVCDGISGIVIGKILKIDQHPNADKLVICQVDIGETVLQIVTGATNVREGHLVPVATHGAVVSGGLKIKKGKLRGEESNGMLCSLAELGFDSAVIPKAFDDGILILNEEYPLGADFIAYFQLNEPVIEFEITPNRPDCLSITGIAREVKATLEAEYTHPEAKTSNTPTAAIDGLSIDILADDLCPRYVAKVIHHIQVKPSPLWMQLRLMQAGMRPVNNIVDITNYVMLESGQPIHAFDLSCVEGDKIVIRKANESESITTLDDKERSLQKDMLLIADAVKPIAIAGVMGGANTEITDLTKSVLIEVASFDKSSVRKTSKDLGLRTEASSRFEKGVSESLPLWVADRVSYWIETLGAGLVSDDVIDVYKSPKLTHTISFSHEKMNKMIGMSLSEEDINALLKRLDIHVTGDIASIPDYRLDLLKEIDLVEEVARMYGYDRIGMSLPKMNAWGSLTNGQMIEEQAKLELIASGVDEVLTYSFVSKSDLDAILVPETSSLRQVVTLINPLGEEFSVMRRTLIPNVLSIISRNYNRKCSQLRVFELGNIFIPRDGQLPVEKRSLTIGAYGANEDFFTLKGIVDNLFIGLGIEGYYFEKEENHPTFHMGRCANIIWESHVIGTIGEIHPLVQENYNIGLKTYIADIDFNIVMQMAAHVKRYKPVPKFPAIERDLAILVADDVTSLQVERLIKEVAGDLLESVVLFDMYKGTQIAKGHKSLAYALVFRSPERTLTDDDVTPCFERILKTLEAKVDAKLR